MARIIQNDKGFKLIEMSMKEIVTAGGYAICDYCNGISDKGVYIAVLNSWYCMECFDRWYVNAKRYVEDYIVEKENFRNMKNLLGI